MDEKIQPPNDEIRLDPDKLTEQQLEELARMVVRKLKLLMRQESDRSGR